MVSIRQSATAKVQIAERSVVKDGAKCAQTLLEDLAAMCDKQQAERRTLLAQPLVIERGNHRLASPGRRHKEVSPAVMSLPLRLQTFENLLLEGVRANIEQKRMGQACRSLQLDSGGKAIGLVCLELGVVPVGLECGIETINQFRRTGLGQAYVPLKALVEGCVRHVRRADECCTEPATTANKPGLRMQACDACVIGDFDIRADAPQGVQCPRLGDPSVGCR